MNRRTVLAGTAAVVALPGAALAAISAGQAEKLIGKVVADINSIINSGMSESKMISRFEGVFRQYADTDFIALAALGVDGRSASASQKSAFTKAFTGYIANRYGSRFREFEGGKIEVVSSKQVKSRFEVLTMTKLQGKAPFDVVFIVSSKNGKFIDMQVEGISIVKSERKEIGAMLDKRKGDLDLLIRDLAKY
ncbi:ABC transporter substrate-binding protein [Aliiroseovarius crassostreae]|uniref:MlaC/ttg2D family ABC transporter substrate-binding protein n=1 Tax=Aliiroseovarius crassostreae TaxID=154981 RepID=UPI0021FD19CD|nr:ABC transporter substrate-binding protein [Aliiroseovarius crassostreae]UWQ10576.1 ABC transporter substrate-binding protein [Aliiroseovarius crassostreae]